MTQIRSPHVDRLFRLLACLQSGKRFEISELAQRCAIGRRAVLRDIQLLRELDYPITVDENTQTCILPGATSGPPTCLLTAEQAALLALSVELSPLRQVPGMAAELSSALARILGTVPEAQRHEISRLLALCEVEGGAGRDRSNSGEVLLAILYAMRSGRRLRVRYREEDGQSTTTRVIPYRLLLTGGTWQMVGRSGAHRKLVRWDVARICQAVPLDEAGVSGVSSGFSAANEALSFQASDP